MTINLLDSNLMSNSYLIAIESYGFLIDPRVANRVDINSSACLDFSIHLNLNAPVIEVLEFYVSNQYFVLKIFLKANFLKPQLRVNCFQISLEEYLIEHCLALQGSFDTEQSFKTFESVFTRVTDCYVPLVEAYYIDYIQMVQKLFETLKNYA